MNYIVLDMEWNQAYQNSRRVYIGDSRRVLTGEVIQIGAVKLNENFEICDTFSSVVKPRFYKKLHFKVEKLTGITKDQLKDADTFDKVFDSFMEWCGDDAVFLIWGFDDIDILEQNIEINNCESEKITWYNVQLIYSRQLNSDNLQVALSTACESFSIEQDRRLHNALNDAYYTALLCSRLDMQKGLEYCAKQKKQSEQNLREKYKYFGFSSISEALDYSVQNDNACPGCGALMTVEKSYKRKGLNQYLAVLSCENDGKMSSKICIIKESENHFKASKTVAKLTSQFEKLYFSKGTRRKRTKHKQNYGKTTE